MGKSRSKSWSVEQKFNMVMSLIKNQASAEELAKRRDVLDSYRIYYNTQRPHQAISYQTPLEIIKQARLRQLSPLWVSFQHD